MLNNLCMSYLYRSPFAGKSLTAYAKGRGIVVARQKSMDVAKVSCTTKVGVQNGRRSIALSILPLLHCLPRLNATLL